MSIDRRPGRSRNNHFINLLVDYVTNLGRGFFYNFIFKIKKSVSLFCASTGGLSRRYLKSNPKVDLNSELFLKGHLQVGLISICKCYGFISGMRLTNHFRSRNHCRQEIMTDPRCFCSSAHPLPLPPILSHPTLCL